jgi:hypothetical protein
MLSAIAVRNSNSPGNGFYVLAKNLGELKNDSLKGRKQFWEAEKLKVYKMWKKESK